MNLQQLNCFLSISKTLSFTRTAEDMYMSQPAVSKYIANLENELGVLLIDRSRKREPKLTEAGKVLCASLERCRSDFLKAYEKISWLDKQKNNTLGICEGCRLPDSIYNQIEDFRSASIRRSFDWQFASVQKLITGFFEGAFDAIICAQDILPNRGSFETRVISNEPVPYAVIFPDEHDVFRKVHKVSLRDLAPYWFYLSKELPAKVVDLYTGYIAENMGVHPKLNLLENQATVMLHLRAKDGYTICSLWSHEVLIPRICSLELKTSINYVVAWRPSFTDPAIKTLIDQL